MHDVSVPEWALARGREFRPPQPLAPERTAVLVIDLQNYFLEPGMPMANPHAADMLPAANRAIRMLRDAGCLIVHTLAEADPAMTEGATRGKLVNGMTAHLREGAHAFALYAGLDTAPSDRVVPKRRPSMFNPRSHVDVPALFAGRAIDTVVVMGVVTNGCCECTARDAYQLGYRVLFLSDATAAMTDAEHNAALLNLACYFADVVTVDELAERLKASALAIPKEAV